MIRLEAFKQKNLTIWHIVALSLGVFFFPSCKPIGQNTPPATELSTLDNLDKTRPFQLNQCGDVGKSGLDLEQVASCLHYQGKDPAIQTALSAALGAVPKLILNSFCTAFNGKIVVSTAQAKKTCSNLSGLPEELANETGRSGDYHACVSPPGSAAALYFSEHPEIIRHAMIRLMSFVPTATMLNLSKQPNLQATARQGLEIEKRQLRQLAKTFFGESQGLSGSYDSLQNQQLVFVEALDSYHCSKQTFDRFGSFYPETYRFFSDDQLVKKVIDNRAQSYSLTYGDPWWIR